MTNTLVQSINVQELNARREHDNTLCLIDVREPYEWDEGHIPGALLIPKDELPMRISSVVPQHDCPIYLYCRGGVRSWHAAEHLITLGYRNVYSVEGGIMAWAQAKYPLNHK